MHLAVSEGVGRAKISFIYYFEVYLPDFDLNYPTCAINGIGKEENYCVLYYMDVQISSHVNG